MIFYRKKYTSEINGDLTLIKYIGGWNLKISQGLQYSGTYLENMWKNILSKYEDETPSKVLILGSGAGCSADIAKKFWPEAEIDAVDYDPIIIEIGKKIYNFNNSKVKFIVSDANKFIKSTTTKYDFVIIDIFVENTPSKILQDHEFNRQLLSIVNPEVNLVINVSTSAKKVDEKLIHTIQNTFPELKPCKVIGNLLLVTKERHIHSDYKNIFQSSLYKQVLKHNGHKTIGSPGNISIIQSFFGFSLIINSYTDIEPDIKTIKQLGYKHGIIFWLPWRLRFVPPGWLNDISPAKARGNGYSIVTKNYIDKWSQSARRDLKIFKTDSINIEMSDKDTFYLGAKDSISSKRNTNILKNSVKQMENENVAYWVARKNRDILGGLATVDYDNTSYNITSFITNIGEKKCVGTGLIDRWYKYALEKNIKYLNFGHIRQKNEPRSWKGFSNFKRKFIDKEIKLQNGYVKFF